MGVIIVKKPYSLSGEIVSGFKHLAGQHDQKLHGRWSTGKRDITQTPEFKKWFGNSKVVDENGKPLVVYHGTNADFDAFYPLSHFGTQEQANNVWLVSSPHEFPRTLPVYLSIKNPIEVKDTGITWATLLSEAIEQKKINAKDGNEFWSKLNESVKKALPTATNYRIVHRIADKKVADYLISRGVDGAKYKNEVEGDGYSWIAFSPTQIKSTFNQGTFDPNDPRILKEKHTTVMVCFDAEMTKIATDLPDKTDIVPDRHITLLYLGDSDSLLQSKQGIIDLLQSFSSEYAPIEGQFNGIATFAKTLENDNKSPIVALYDSPALPGFRQALKKKFDTYNDFPEQTHGFTPHMTLGYTAEPYEFTGEFKPIKARFDKISLWWGDEHIDFELTGKTTAKSLQEAIVEGFKHLQGKHDQKTHGNWAGIAGYRYPPAEFSYDLWATTVKPAQEVTSQLDERIRFPLPRFEKQNTKRVVQGWVNYVKESTGLEMEDFIKEIVFQKNTEYAGAVYSAGIMEINPIDSRGITRDNIYGAAIFAHEVAHVIARKHLDAEIPIRDRRGVIIGFRRKNKSYDRFIERLMMESNFGDFTSYGKTNEEEAFAESFALYLNAGGKKRDRTRVPRRAEKVFRAIDKIIDEIKDKKTLKHLAGKHDQKTHGNWAGNPYETMRFGDLSHELWHRYVPKAETLTPEVENAIDFKPKSSERKNLKLRVQGWINYIKESTGLETDQFFNTLTVKRNLEWGAGAVDGYGRMYIESFDEDGRMNQSVGYWTPAVAVFSHEAAHVIVRKHLFKFTLDKNGNAIRKSKAYEKFERRIVDEKGFNHFTTYSSTDPEEAFAESFTLYLGAGGKNRKKIIVPRKAERVFRAIDEIIDEIKDKKTVKHLQGKHNQKLHGRWAGGKVREDSGVYSSSLDRDDALEASFLMQKESISKRFISIMMDYSKMSDYHVLGFLNNMKKREDYYDNRSDARRMQMVMDAFPVVKKRFAKYYEEIDQIANQFESKLAKIKKINQFLIEQHPDIFDVPRMVGNQVDLIPKPSEVETHSPESKKFMDVYFSTLEKFPGLTIGDFQASAKPFGEFYTYDDRIKETKDVIDEILNNAGKIDFGSDSLNRVYNIEKVYYAGAKEKFKKGYEEEGNRLEKQSYDRNDFSYTGHTFGKWEKRAHIKDQICYELSQETGVDYETIRKYMSAWAEGSQSPYSLELQFAVSEEFGVPIPSYINTKMKKEKTMGLKYTSLRGDDYIKVRKIARGMYEKTQKKLAEMGYKPEDRIVLYRGVGRSQEALKKYKLSSGGYLYSGSPIESWTFNYSTAKSFGKGRGSQVVSAGIQVKNIFSGGIFGIGCYSEDELVVLGTKSVYRVDIGKAYN